MTPVHVVIGQNDSGKTALLESMLALHASANMVLHNAFPGEWRGQELVNERSISPRVAFEAEFGERADPLTYRLEVEFLDTERVCYGVNESVEQAGQAIPLQGGRSGATGVFSRNDIQDARRRYLDLVADAMGVASLYRFEPKLMMHPAVPDPSRNFRMDPDGFGLATLLDDILGDRPERFIELRERFIGYYPEFRSVRLETERAVLRPYDTTGRHLSSQGTGKGIFFETLGGRSIRAQQASDGAILFLGLLALIYSPKPPRLLLIEEPERGVYPKRLEEVIGLLRELEGRPPGVPVPQIVMTTHSPFLLSLFKPDEVTLMSREGGSGPVRARPLRDAPHIQERLGDEEFYLGELWYNLSEEELFADA